MEKESQEKTTSSPPVLPTRKKTAKQPGWLGRNWFGILVMIVAVGAVVALAKFLPKKDTKTTSTPPSPSAVRVMIVENLKEVDDTFRILGSVEPEKIVNVAAEVPGQLKTLADKNDKLLDKLTVKKAKSSGGTVAEGDIVKKGQPLMYLDTDLVKADYDRVKADYDFAQRETARLEKLHAKNVATKAELDLAIKQRDMARADLERSAAHLQRAIIVAPIGGVLNRLPVEVGEYVTPGTAVAQIVDIDTVKVVMEIPERDISYLKVGQDQAILFGKKDSKKIMGKIIYISALADDKAHTTRLEIRVDNKDRLLHSGQMVYAELKRRTLKDVVMIPLKTIVPLEKGYVVYLSDNGKALRREIKLDRSMFRNNQIRITKGLKAGDRLIIEPTIGPGQAIIEADQKTEPQKSPTTAPAATDNNF